MTNITEIIKKRNDKDILNIVKFLLNKAEYDNISFIKDDLLKIDNNVNQKYIEDFIKDDNNKKTLLFFFTLTKKEYNNPYKVFYKILIETLLSGNIFVSKVIKEYSDKVDNKIRKDLLKLFWLAILFSICFSGLFIYFIWPMLS